MSKSQIDKFREAAKQFGLDEAEYEAAVVKVANSPKLSNEEIKEFAKKLREAKSLER
jgi:hypothetical protein